MKSVGGEIRQAQYVFRFGAGLLFFAWSNGQLQSRASYI